MSMAKAVGATESLKDISSRISQQGSQTEKKTGVPFPQERNVVPLP